MPQKIQKLTPKTANTTNKLIQLNRDNIDVRKIWMLVEERHVVIANPATSNPSSGSIRLTKNQFERFIKFYETGK